MVRLLEELEVGDCSLEGRQLAGLSQVWAAAPEETPGLTDFHWPPSGTRKGRIEPLADCRVGGECKAGAEHKVGAGCREGGGMGGSWGGPMLLAMCGGWRAPLWVCARGCCWPCLMIGWGQGFGCSQW